MTITKLVPHLWVGCVKDIPNLPNDLDFYLLDCRCLEDDQFNDSLFNELVMIGIKQMKKQPVFVFCQFGHNRSVAVALEILCHLCESLLTALELIRKRDEIYVHPAYMHKIFVIKSFGKTCWNCRYCAKWGNAHGHCAKQNDKTKYLGVCEKWEMNP